jgi:hypothetical protein
MLAQANATKTAGSHVEPATYFVLTPPFWCEKIIDFFAKRAGLTHHFCDDIISIEIGKPEHRFLFLFFAA